MEEARQLYFDIVKNLKCVDKVHEKDYPVREPSL